MPNLCFYSMQVQGKLENVDEFIKVIKANYDYTKNEFSYERHLWRVFNADVYEEKEENGIKTVKLSGDCAWSVSACMFDRATTYQASRKREADSNGTKNYGTDIITESKNLNLAIEIFSQEDGMCFREHYTITNGDLIVDQCNEYTSYYWNKNEYPTIAEFNEDNETSFNEDDFDDEGYCLNDVYNIVFTDYSSLFLCNSVG